MTGTEKDPFERLSQIVVPEPDPRKLATVMAMSSRAFAQDHARATDRPKRKRWLANWFTGAGWAIPASAVAVVLAVLSIPLLGQFDIPGFRQESHTPSNEQLADNEILSRAPSLSRGTDTNEGTRRSATPARQGSQSPLPTGENVTTETYDFGGLHLVARSTPEDVILSLKEGDIERRIDRRLKEPSETIVVSDAFIHHSGEASTPLLLIRSGYDDGPQQWDAFAERDGGYVLSGAISLAIHDAADRAEVIIRLQDDTTQRP